MHFIIIIIINTNECVNIFHLNNYKDNFFQ